MGKHDQRILKFLNQNASSAPTITDMMTRLNISISEISSSLNNLLAQGLIARKSNNQGIECWFPANSPMAAGADRSPSGGSAIFPNSAQPQPQSAPVVSPYAAAQAPPSPVMAAPTQFSGGYQETLSPSAGYASKATVVKEYSPPPAPQAVYSPPPFNPRAMGLVPQSRGVGFGSFLLGLIAMGGLAAWGGARLSQKNMATATTNLVDQKTFTASLAARTEFETKAQAQLLALQADLKKLSLAMDSSKSPTVEGAASASAPAPVAAKPDPAAAAAEAAKKAAAAKKLAAQKAAAKKIATRKAQSARKRRAAEIEAAAAAASPEESSSSGGSGSEDPGLDSPSAE